MERRWSSSNDSIPEEENNIYQQNSNKFNNYHNIDDCDENTEMDKFVNLPSRSLKKKKSPLLLDSIAMEKMTLEEEEEKTKSFKVEKYDIRHEIEKKPNQQEKGKINSKKLNKTVSKPKQKQTPVKSKKRKETNGKTKKSKSFFKFLNIFNWG